MQFSPRAVLRSLVAFLIAGVVIFLSVEMSVLVYLFGIAGLIPSRINIVHLELPPASGAAEGFGLQR